MARTTGICILLLAFSCVMLLVGQIRQGNQINKLKNRVACLEHPHGESSVTATKINGKWIVTKPTRTGC